MSSNVVFVVSPPNSDRNREQIKNSYITLKITSPQIPKDQWRGTNHMQSQELNAIDFRERESGERP